MKSKDYNPAEIEAKWSKKWEEEKIYQPNLDGVKDPFYNLMMFPYPSAEGLHVGNVYAFTGADTYGRFKRMQGNDVFEPIGLDGFGIHSENYALKVGKHPKEQAQISEKNFYRQLSSIGNGFDWSRKVETYDPNYYKWTQWIFIQLFKRGLAYRKKAPVNFCPKDLTVLADEQVVTKLKIKNEKLKIAEEVKVCERCETPVEIRNLEQWFFKITDYAERLLNNIPQLNWTEKVKISQKEWIGKKEGIKITYHVIASTFGKLSVNSTKQSQNGFSITVFTTAPVNFGMSFLVVSPEYEFVSKILKGQVVVPDDRLVDIKKYTETYFVKKKAAGRVEEKTKTGVFTGLYALNPINNKEVPIWISDFVLMEVGTGAVQGCPGHDYNDFEFAKKYKLPIPRVIVGPDGDMSEIKTREQVIEKGMKGKFVNSEFLNGLDFEEGLQKTMDYFEEKGWGKRVTTYHLRDWLISRQRYWGPPIPMIYCQNCAEKGHSWFTEKNLSLETRNLKLDKEVGKSKIEKSRTSSFEIQNQASNFQHLASTMNGWFPVPDGQLPVLLPDVEDWKPKGTGTSPLANIKEFVETTCPKCGGTARRETDVSDTFLDSAWYFFRYLATEWEDVPFPSKTFTQTVIARSDATKQSPKDQIAAGSANPRNDISGRVRWLPVTMYIGGAEHSVLHLLYSRFITMVFKDMGLIDFEEPYARFYANGLIIKDGAKMSKSRGNVISPDEYLKKYGADTLRTYLRFVGPFDMGGDFRDSGIEGMYRFLKRVWKLVHSSCHPELARPELAEWVSGSTNAVKEMPKHPPALAYAEHWRAGVRHDNQIRMMHRSIKGVTEDLENLRFNTAVAKLMTWYNYLSEQKEVSKEELTTFLKLLAPIAPFIAEELWQNVIASDSAAISGIASSSATPRNDGVFQSIHLEPWPGYDPKFLEEDEVTIAVQINGKTRDTIRVKSAKLKVKSDVEEKVRKSEKIKKYLEGKSVKKIIYIEAKVINFVLEN